MTDSQQPRTLRLLSWNLWYGGEKMHEGADRQAELLAAERPDVVCLQECWGDAAARLGRRLGLSVAQQDFDNAILSRWPVQLLSTDTAPYATAAVVWTPEAPVLVWSVHLEHTDYGPYRADELPRGAEAVFAQEGERLRDEQAEKILEVTAERLAELPEGTAVVVAGDFNVPSPQDWNGGMRPAAQWPATARMLEAGFVDAFRSVHPDPVLSPGLTWSQIHTLSDEPRDRIDFVFVNGFEVRAAEHLGGAADDHDALQDAGFREYGGTARHIPEHEENSFASDHLAVQVQLVQGQLVQGQLRLRS
ncbi:endonuclease/exonuclease/phosphatase family protein [Nesterenkonia aerolata]|uniref:Endonuclease/exonuclease/phosphatase family protein n=1 Tax=Nesterenkonia aerolata TaxID=3074079 RepID=A0ABU2DUI2_9MICC|nr:endonuclease/exonuclease/phosphatase family protein [Nesterenkonia sp. LY-0111]MDR8020159.1 endonuclease/exonuclease/phosphatase family protein [Nesterenkonia sp. LY-0111]